MPGFFCAIGNLVDRPELKESFKGDLIIKSISTPDFCIEQRTVNKFLNDKVFIENNSYIYLIEGVVLNSKELIRKYNCNNLSETIPVMYEAKGREFFKEFRGSFSGLFFDKEKDLKILFTDQIGDKQVFYSITDNIIILGSEINFITDYFNKIGLKYSFNKKSAYNLLTFGFLLEEDTFFIEIKKLMAGHYLFINSGKPEIIRYYRLDNEPDENQTEESIIENIDALFRNAVKRSFEKDREYGYKHLVGLSGGLDSRMTTWVANDLGYGNEIVNFTFSKSGYLDEVIPKKITEHLKHEWIFKSLDNGLFMKKIEDVVRISAGGALYYGMAHGKSCFDLLNTKPFGIIHTGMLGDVVISTFYSTMDKNKKYSLSQGSYSKLLKHKVADQKLKLHYENEEIFKFYTRGFSGANQGLLVAQEFSETYSPFYDIDLLEFCLKIPLKYRFKHKIYIKWILTKYPGAAKFKWGKQNTRISDNKLVILMRVLYKHIFSNPKNSILKKLGLRKTGFSSSYHMNPLDYWYKHNHDLKKFLDNYYESNIIRLCFDEELKNDCEYMYMKGKCIEKTQVLTLLAVLKLYFNKDRNL